MPGEGLTHGPRAKEMHAAVTTGSARSSGIPCAMGYGLYALSAGTGFLAPVRDNARALRGTSAPGGPDHTTSPSARMRSSALVIRMLRTRTATAPRLTFVTTAIRPIPSRRDAGT